MKKKYLIILLVSLTFSIYSQTHWTKHPDNPVMVPGAAGEWDESFIAPQSVIYCDSVYHMWYWGGILYEKEQIGHATSPDGIHWTKDPMNPVLELGPKGSWDDHLIHGCSVILVDSVFHMWYTGHAGTDIYGNWRIGHATSPDGINWIKDASNPVVDLDPSVPLDEGCSVVASVLYINDLYHIWFISVDWGKLETAHATSTDGINWTKDPENPVLSPENNTWELEETTATSVVHDGTIFHLWYGAHGHWEWRIGHATSLDGSSWDKSYHYNPVLVPSESGNWDDKSVGFNVVIDSAGIKYKTWYCGSRVGQTGSIGYAESSPFVEIPDTAFLHALIDEGVDTDGDSLISYVEAEAVTSLYVNHHWPPFNGGITSLEGIQAFINLDTLTCFNQSLTSLDLSKNTALKFLWCEANPLTSLDLSNNTALRAVDCSHNQLTSLDVSNCIELEILYCVDSQLPYLNVEGNTRLSSLTCRMNNLTYLNISNNPEIVHLDISGMPTLSEVCVWTEPFPPEGVFVDIVESPNVYFTTDCKVTDLNSYKEENSISIYPNPSDDIINIEIENPINATIEIYNIMGKLLYSNTTGSKIDKIDVSNYTAGIYLIMVKQIDWIYIEKVIVR